MNAFTNRRYGSEDVLKLEELPIPEPNDNEVLIRVHATSVNAADWHLLRAEPFIMRFMEGFSKPKTYILGADVAGKVETVGKNVTSFKPGDEVYGDLSGNGFGGFAEYACAIERALAHKPANLSYEEAAAIPLAAITALQALRIAEIKAGKKVLINGASGGVGSFAVQIAKAYETEVTAVCSSRNVEQSRGLGADHVIDYTKEDFTQNGQHYDLIVGANGYHPLSHYKRALAENGRYVVVGGQYKQMFGAMFFGWYYSLFGSKKFRVFVAKPTRADLLFLKDLAEQNKLKPVISHKFKFDQIPEAVRQVYTGHSPGKVVINIV